MLNRRNVIKQERILIQYISTLGKGAKVGTWHQEEG